jgi:hypothetical protein
MLPLLQRRGRMQAGELLVAVDVSRATLMRAVRAAGDQLVVLGQARRTTYAARRLLRGSAAPLPLYRVDRQGEVHAVGQLHLTEPAFSSAVEFTGDTGWLLDGNPKEAWFDGLPYPLYDMRPQGFVGRNFARQHSQLLQVDENPERWSDDDIVHALSLLGDDVSGDLVVGEPACRRFLDRVARFRAGTPPDAIADDDIATAYPLLAEQAMAGGVAGSSAGGEFPKFTALRRDSATGELRQVLVKFSGSDDGAGTRRWADLLACEHLALQTLRDDLGLPVAESAWHRADGRVFLELTRFDRHGLFGRSALLSWATLNAGLFGVGNLAWGDVGRLLVGRGWLTDGDDAARLDRLACFGQLIANSDMHDGNLSFEPAPAGVRLAPVYDMLPMRYAPRPGLELPTPDFSPRLPMPAQRDAWQAAARAALRFWQSAEGDGRISDGFRGVCRGNALALRGLVAG